MCTYRVCVSSLISTWERENCHQLNRKTEHCLNQSSVKKEVFFPDLEYCGTYSIQF